MRTNLLLIFSFVCLFSCTKEGLPGPEGAPGPEGPPGTGGGGGNLRVLSYTMPVGATLFWEKLEETTTEVAYVLRYNLNGISSSSITLPDSVKGMIDEGNLLIYGQVVPRADPSQSIWHQFNYASAEYEDIEMYTYQLVTTNTRYRARIEARMLKRTPTHVRTPIAYTQIRFVIIPLTKRLDLEVPEF